MSNSNDKQPLDPEPLLVSVKAQAPSRDVRPWEKNDSLGISGINQPDHVTTGNLSHSDEASTNTDETIAILLDCEEIGQNRGNQCPPSICKVSKILRDLSKSSFKPQLVSIGPIHRENEKLKEFELLKVHYLIDLLNRFRSRSTPKETLEACLQKVNDLIPQIRESYAGVKKNYSDVELARMMVMDGCFILEFCFKNEDENWHSHFLPQKKGNWHLPNKMQNSRIAMDLMLLENQVPFFVLQALFDCLATYMGSVTLSQVLDYCLAPYIMLFHSLLPEKISTTNVDSDEKISTTDVDSDSTHDHVLGYLHKRCQLVVTKSSNRIRTDQASEHVDEERQENTYTAFHSIVELDRSGMNFKPHQSWSMTFKKSQPSLFPRLLWFWSTPTLLMPALVIDDSTELILRNFIAYEQLFRKDRDCFTSYAVAMDILIDTQEDIAKLVESKVLVNRLGSNQEAADMINKICKNRFVTDYYYIQAFIKMDKYYNSFWPKNIARLRRTYFSNPWSAIALLAATILFSLTVVQTVYTLRGT